MARTIPVALVALALLASGCGFGFGGASPTPSAACPTAAPTAAQAQQILADAGRAIVTTNKGAFTIELYGAEAPIATANFVALARCGFYHDITFHRVVADFVVQAGDPATKENRNDFESLGRGGPGYQFAIEPPADDLNYDRYVVAMANAGHPDTNGSQFFIALADLDGVRNWQRTYTIFGKVVDGTDVVDAIGRVPTNGARAVPLDPVIISSIAVEAPSASPSGG